MKMRDTIRRAGRSLRQAKARTLLTSLAIGVGAFTITLSLAAGAGGRQYSQEIVRANTDTREINVSKKQQQNQGPQEYTPSETQSAARGFISVALLAQSDIDRMNQVGNVEMVTPAYALNPTYITRPAQKQYAISSLGAQSSHVKLQYKAGSVPDNLPIDGIVLTDDYSRALGFTNPQQALGQTVSIMMERVSGRGVQKQYDFIVTAVSSKSGLALRANGSLLISPVRAKEMYDYAQQGTRDYQTYTQATVIARSDSDVEAVKQQLVKMGYEAQSAQDLLGTIFQFVNVLQGILLGFGALAVLTSIFGIINTQYISVLERTQQIGLMKALGMRRRDIGQLFKFEAAWIGFLGGTIGSGAAVVAGVLANPSISKALNLDGMNLLIFNPLAVAGVVAGLMLVAVGAGILPARRAAKLDPIEALRTE
jgi:putative ABC transport system permease protein